MHAIEKMQGDMLRQINNKHVKYLDIEENQHTGATPEDGHQPPSFLQALDFYKQKNKDLV